MDKITKIPKKFSFISQQFAERYQSQATIAQTNFTNQLYKLKQPIIDSGSTTHHFLGVVCWHVDLFAVLPDRVIGRLFTPARLLRLQPLLIKLIHIWN